MGQAPLDCSLDKARGQEGQRDRHVDLAYAALFARGNGFDSHAGVGDDFVQPASASGNRGDEKGAVLGADWADSPRRRRFRWQNLSASCRWGLAPWHLDLLAPRFPRCERAFPAVRIALRFVAAPREERDRKICRIAPSLRRVGRLLPRVRVWLQHLAIEMPGSMAKYRQNDGETDKQW